MQRMVIAVDVDGTLFDGTTVAPAAVAALTDASASGHVLIVVSGRRCEDLPEVLGQAYDLFDLIVGEEGSVMVDVSTGALTILADPLDPVLVDALRAAGVRDLAVGHVVVGAPATQARLVAGVRDAVAAERRLVVNKASVALVPPGCDKGTGLRAAMDALGVSSLPILAIGDAENDLPMFAMATVAVGVANADAAVRRSGVRLTQAAAGEGVAEALLQHLPAASRP